jgi:hypothetical protein
MDRNTGSASPANAAWFVADRGQRSGPYTWPRLVALASRGEIPADVMLFKDGSSRWVRAATLRAFFAPVAEAPVDDVQPVTPDESSMVDSLHTEPEAAHDYSFDVNPTEELALESVHFVETLALPSTGLKVQYWTPETESPPQTAFSEPALPAMLDDVQDKETEDLISTPEAFTPSESLSAQSYADELINPASEEELPADSSEPDSVEGGVSDRWGKGLFMVGLTVLLTVSIALGFLVGGVFELNVPQTRPNDVNPRCVEPRGLGNQSPNSIPAGR